MKDAIDFYLVIGKMWCGHTNFYLNFDPTHLADLQPKTAFTIVYCSMNGEPWEAVDYRVIEPQKAYSVIKRRTLSTLEIRYFQNLLTFGQLKQRYDSLSDQMHDRRFFTIVTQWIDAPAENYIA